jgi:hypothetical protein
MLIFPPSRIASMPASASPARRNFEFVGLAVAQVPGPVFEARLGDRSLEILERRLEYLVVVVVDRDDLARVDDPDRLDTRSSTW